MTTDPRLDALRDMLIERRDPEALRLIAEIAEDGPEVTPLERLRAVRRDHEREMGRLMDIELEVGSDYAYKTAEFLKPGIKGEDIGLARRSGGLSIAEGIRIFPSRDPRLRTYVAKRFRRIDRDL